MKPKHTELIQLHHSTVIITGAAGGIGSAIVKQCLNAGAVVLGCDLNLEALEEIQHDNFHAFQLDVSDYQQTETLFKHFAQEFPQCNALVNNAGIYFGQSLLEYSPQQIDKIISVNIKGTIYTSQLFAKHFMDNSRCAIVNISSVSGQEGSSDAVYGLSKAALFGLTKSCALNFAPNIRINAVAPGLVATNMLGNIPQ